MMNFVSEGVKSPSCDFLHENYKNKLKPKLSDFWKLDEFKKAINIQEAILNVMQNWSKFDFYACLQW